MGFSGDQALLAVRRFANRLFALKLPTMVPASCRYGRLERAYLLRLRRTGQRKSRRMKLMLPVNGQRTRSNAAWSLKRAKIKALLFGRFRAH